MLLRLVILWVLFDYLISQMFSLYLYYRTGPVPAKFFTEYSELLSAILLIAERSTPKAYIGKTLASLFHMNVSGSSNLSGREEHRRACVRMYPLSIKNHGTHVKPKP